MIKKYIKDESFDPIYKHKNSLFWAKTKLLPKIIILSGVTLLGSQVFYPLVYFKTSEITDQETVITNASVLGIASGFREFEFKELDSAVITTADNKPTPKTFKITIPKLGITDAVVEVNAPTLKPDNALGHYLGSSLPGENGNAFIYGHSVLPFFYNPKNYKTIFSTLDKLKIGDTFYVEYNNQTLEYKIESREIMEPEKVNPLAEIKPKYLNESTLTLMTCTPAGTKDKRLLVNAVLVKN